MSYLSLLITGNREESLEEISLKLKNSIYLEKSELEQQYVEVRISFRIRKVS